MKTIRLTTKSSIESALRQNIFLHIYSIGDLDDFFWPYTTWYALQDAGKIQAIALLYRGPDLPTLLALTEHPNLMNILLESISHQLPECFYAHLSPGTETGLESTHLLEPHGELLKMALKLLSAVELFDCSETARLGPAHVDEITAFYERCYPGNWFDPRMLETGQYFGIRRQKSLVSIAGIHVFSPGFRVAALGNIATAPSCRNRGFGSMVTARTCQSLLKHVSSIELNVKADNKAAISCYEKLGFERVADYGEFLVQRK